MLYVIEEIAKQMIDKGIMLKASIAYGSFDYVERSEYYGINKNLLHGKAYINAYLDTDVEKPKLEPGICRIIMESEDKNFWNTVCRSENDHFFSRIRKRRGDQKHLYFYWMVPNNTEINNFDKQYKKASDDIYKAMLLVLKKYVKFSPPKSPKSSDVWTAWSAKK